MRYRGPRLSESSCAVPSMGDSLSPVSGSYSAVLSLGDSPSCIQRIRTVPILLCSPLYERQPLSCVQRILVWETAPVLCPEDSDCPDPPMHAVPSMGDSPNSVSGGSGLSRSYSAVSSLGDNPSPVSRGSRQSGSSCAVPSMGDSLCPVSGGSGLSGSSCAVPSMGDSPCPVSGVPSMGDSLSPVSRGSDPVNIWS